MSFKTVFYAKAMVILILCLVGFAQKIVATPITPPLRDNIAWLSKLNTYQQDFENALPVERRGYSKKQPNNYTGWIYTYFYEGDSSVGPCKGTILHFNALPTGQCLQDVNKSVGSYLFECKNGFALKRYYGSNDCNASSISDVITIGNIDQCSLSAEGKFQDIAYQSIYCTHNITLPIPPMEEFMLQRSFNQIKCRSPLSSIVGLKNRFCLAIRDDVTIRSEFIDYPFVFTFQNSSTCDGQYTLGRIPQGCVSEPDPITQALSYMFTVETGEQETFFRRMNERRLVRNANGILGLFFLTIVIISGLMEFHKHLQVKHVVESTKS